MIYHNLLTDDTDPYDLTDLERVVRRTTKALRPHLDSFDSIVATGLSGVLVATPVALRLRKPLVVLRKENDGSHHESFQGGEYVFINDEQLGKRTLVIDDFVSLGSTWERVKIATKSRGAKIAGTYLYRDDKLRLKSTCP